MRHGGQVTFALRTLTADDLEAVSGVLEYAFGGPPFAEQSEDRDVEFGVVDPARFYAAYDGAEPVVTGGSFGFQMTVPGRRLPVAGVTWVGVLPSHRRRGLLTALMQRMLTDLHEAGEAVAALWASQGAIYQRFGYGPASWHASLTVPSRAAFTVPVQATGLRLVTPTADCLQAAYDAAAATRGGWFDRDEAWWAFRLHDPASRRSGASALRCVVADGVGGVAGYALYRTKPSWGGSGPSGEVQVRELVAADPAVRAQLWRYLLDIDLMSTVSAPMGPVDEPLLHLLAEPRSASPVLSDNLWVRLVDVPAALAGRCYASEVDVVLEVTDDTCPWNAGRFRLTGGPAGATCTATTDQPELRVRAADLGAAYLGGTSLLARAGAGHVVELRAGALAEASLAFGWTGPSAYCPIVF